MKLFQLLLLPVAASYAFVAPNSKLGVNPKTVLSARPPEFNADTQLWEYTDESQYPDQGYDIIGTVLRHGPLPFFNRLLDNQSYEQSVLKYMAVEKVDRLTAQGNMDAFLANPNDWLYYRQQEKITGKAPDYTVLNEKQAALSVFWGVSITYLIAVFGYSMATQTSFNDNVFPF